MDPSEVQSCEKAEKSILTGLSKSGRRIGKGFDLRRNPEQCANNPTYFPAVYKASLESKVSFLTNLATNGCIAAFKKSLEAPTRAQEFTIFESKAGEKGIAFLNLLVQFIGKPVVEPIHFKVNNIINQSVSYNPETKRYELIIDEEDGQPILYQKIKEQL